MKPRLRALPITDEDRRINLGRRARHPESGCHADWMHNLILGSSEQDRRDADLMFGLCTYEAVPPTQPPRARILEFFSTDSIISVAHRVAGQV